MAKSMRTMHSYKMPSPEIRYNRKKFYDLHRRFEEPIEKWLKRIETRINHCDFAEFTEYLLIDKFVGDLNDLEFEVMRNTRLTWSFKQLRGYIWDIMKTDNNTMSEETDYGIGEIPVMDIVKSQPVCQSKEEIS